MNYFERHDMQFEYDGDKEVLRECYTIDGREVSKDVVKAYHNDLLNGSVEYRLVSRKVYFKDGCLKRQKIGLNFEVYVVSYYNQDGVKCYSDDGTRITHYHWDENGYIIGILDYYPNDSDFEFRELIDGKWSALYGNEEDILGNNLFIMKEVEI